MLKETFIELVLKYTSKNQPAIELWNEIETNYSDQKRHYHTLKHLNNLLNQLILIKDVINNLDTILFTLFYHDIIYNVLKSNNEDQSAELAVTRMKQILVPNQMIEDCKSQILATKKHLFNSDYDTNYFTDVDLSVLGQDWKTYSEYYKNVRKEYSIYPNLVYNPGRKKVLIHFLEMDRIFKTDYFYSKFEQQAKYNLQKELELLK